MPDLLENQKTIDEGVDRGARALTAAIAQAEDAAHGLLDRLSGTRVQFVKWGFVLTIPPRVVNKS